jgi:hypothetical protein
MLRRADSTRRPRLTVLLITGRSDDTVALASILKRERLMARVQTMTPRDAKKVFDLRKIPAIYLLEKGRVVREWEAQRGAPIAIERNDITKALTEIRNGQRDP